MLTNRQDSGGAKKRQSADDSLSVQVIENEQSDMQRFQSLQNKPMEHEREKQVRGANQKPREEKQKRKKSLILDDSDVDILMEQSEGIE